MSSAITAPPHPWLANVVLLRPPLLITWRRVFWTLTPTPNDRCLGLIDNLHPEQLQAKDP